MRARNEERDDERTRMMTSEGRSSGRISSGRETTTSGAMRIVDAAGPSLALRALSCCFRAPASSPMDSDDEEEERVVMRGGSGRRTMRAATDAESEKVAMKGRPSLDCTLKRANFVRLPNSRRVEECELDAVCNALSQSFAFERLEENVKRRVADAMFLVDVPEGSTLMHQGEEGDALYLIKEGEFDVFEDRLGTPVKVVTRGPGEVVGELALLYSVPRAATVTAKCASKVWVCTREVFKAEVKLSVESNELSKHVFIEQVPVMTQLDIETRKKIAQSMCVVKFEPGARVLSEGDVIGEDAKFYMVSSGRAVVTKLDPNTKVERIVNRLFRHDFFGETELLECNATQQSSVTVGGEDALTCYALDRNAFTEYMTPARDALLYQKSKDVIRRRMSDYAGKNTWQRASIRLAESARVGGASTTISCSGLANPRSFSPDGDSRLNIELIEKELLGGGSGGYVHRVTCRSHGGREYALKRVRKIALIDAPKHVFRELEVSRDINHFSLMCQHASFKDKHNLYMLFDLMKGCDLMDVLASMVSIKNIPTTSADGQVTHIPTQIGLSEDMARYYAGVLTLAFEYLHDNQIIYRDLKPENVLVSLDGKCKLGDFGYAKKLDVGEQAFTFCGTPGYVAPEIVLSKGYGYGVDWWALGVLTYVIVTSSQPFKISVDASEEDLPIKVMRRIVDMTYQVKYPTYASEEVCDFIACLLQRNPSRRLGNYEGGVSHVKNHRWFADFDWTLLESGLYTPRPIRLSPEFLDMQKERLAESEKHCLMSTQMDAARGPNDATLLRAIEMFKDF